MGIEVNATGMAVTLIQALLNSGTPLVFSANSVTNVSGLVTPAIGASIRGENNSAVLHVTANSPAIKCDGGAFLNVSDLTITGTGADYTGYGTGSTDLGQHGIVASDCPSVRVRGVRLGNLSGTGFDFSMPSASSWSAAHVFEISDVIATHSYRGLYTHSGGEYANFSNIQVKNNVFGIEVASGNIAFSNVTALYNSVGIKISGLSSGSNCHGTFNGGQSNHNVYDLVVQSCGPGQTFNGMHFIADQSGGIAPGSQGIIIYNSRGVTIANGQIGVNVSVIATDPNTSSAALSGANLLLNNYVRDDITNFTTPSIGSGASLLMKGNYNAAGPVGWNN